MNAPLYAPGDARVLLLGPVVALLGEGSDDRAVTALWDAVVEGDDLTAFLSIVMRDGLERLPAFALASVASGQVHAFVHGDVEIVVETPTGEQAHDGRRISTWSEIFVDDAVRVTLRRLGAVVGEPATPLIGGVVHASAVTLLVPGTHRAATPPAQVDALAGRSSRDPATASPLPGVPSPPLDPPSSDVVPAPPAPSASAAADPSPVVPEGVLGDTGEPYDTDELDVDTGLDGLGGVDGRTVLSSELVAIRKRLPHWPDDEVPGPFPLPGTSADPDRTVARLVLSSGVVVALDRRVLVGRSPMVSRATDVGEVPRLVTVESPHRDISRTHAQVRMTDDGIEVTDLHSTNGVYLETEGGRLQRVAPGEPTIVAAGALVDIGDGISFVVEVD